MKVILFISFSIIFCCLNHKVDDTNKIINDNMNQINLEWVGFSDKPINTIKICYKCKTNLGLHQYQITEDSFNDIVELLEINVNNKNKVNSVLIDESNRSIYIPKIKKIIQKLNKKKENQELINGLEIFIKRINW